MKLQALQVPRGLAGLEDGFSFDFERSFLLKLGTTKMQKTENTGHKVWAKVVTIQIKMSSNNHQLTLIINEPLLNTKFDFDITQTINVLILISIIVFN